ncbi:MAG: RNA chaperone Hfq [Nitrospirae bacterium]|nr:RNA chaperone Hfq [Nitrospirota bacterium]
MQIQLMNRAVIDGTLADVSRYEVLLQDQQGCHVLTKREIASITCSQMERSEEEEGGRLEATSSNLQPPTSDLQPLASKGRPDIQETFLAQVQAQRQMIDLYLLTGARYRGRLLGYDHFTLYLRDNHKSEDHLFYKHGVSTIHLARP